MRAEMDDFRTVVSALRDAKSMTLEEVGYKAREYAAANNLTGVSLSLIQKRLAPGSDKPPSMALMWSVAAALDVDAEVFAEYRVELARAQLDPAGVGLERAARNAAILLEVLSRQKGGGHEGPPDELLQHHEDAPPSRATTPRGMRLG